MARHFLVTGAAGFIGMHTALRLLERGELVWRALGPTGVAGLEWLKAARIGHVLYPFSATATPTANPSM